jgi:hypothetical protein
MSRLLFGIPVFAVWTLYAGMAIAGDAPECGDGSPAVQMGKVDLSPQERTRIVSQLRVALAPRHIALCDASDATDALAVLDLESTEPPAVTIAVSDRVTHKKVTREVDLRTIPDDGRPLTLALAADELLRASWAELVLRDAPPPQAPIPPEVHEAIERTATHPPPPPKDVVRPAPRFELAGAIAAEHFAGGLDALGVDAALGAWVLPRLGITGRIGLRGVRTVTTQVGDVHATAVMFGLGPALALMPRDARGNLSLFGRALAAYARFSSDPSSAGTLARQDSGVAVYAAAGLAGSLGLTRGLALSAEFGAGAPVHSVRALEGTHDVTALDGLLLFGSLGIGGGFQ